MKDIRLLNALKEINLIYLSDNHIELDNIMAFLYLYTSIYKSTGEGKSGRWPLGTANGLLMI